MYNETSYETEPRLRRNPMAAAALILGILSLATSLILSISVPCGALSVILALLSRTDQPMRKKARAGLICGICGMTASVILTVSAFSYVLSHSDLRALLEYYCQVYTGDYDFSLDDMLEELLPFPGDSPDSSPEPSAPSAIEPKGESTFL